MKSLLIYEHRKDIAIYSIVAIAWATTWISIEYTVETIPPLLASGLRFIISFPIFIFFAKITNEKLFFYKEYPGFFVITTLFYFLFPYLFINISEQHVSGGLASLIFSTMPIFMILITVFYYKENISFIKIFGILIGIIGLLMVILSEEKELSFSNNYAYILLIIAAFMHGLFYVIWSKTQIKVSVITLNVFPPLIAGVILCSSSYIWESHLYNFSNTSIYSLLYLSLFASTFGFIGYFYLLKKFSTYIMGFIFIIFPILAILIDNLLKLKEMSLFSYIGITVTIVGFLFTKLNKRLN